MLIACVGRQRQHDLTGDLRVLAPLGRLRRVPQHTGFPEALGRALRQQHRMVLGRVAVAEEEQLACALRGDGVAGVVGRRAHRAAARTAGDVARAGKLDRHGWVVTAGGSAPQVALPCNAYCVCTLLAPFGRGCRTRCAGVVVRRSVGVNVTLRRVIAARGYNVMTSSGRVRNLRFVLWLACDLHAYRCAQAQRLGRRWNCSILTPPDFGVSAAGLYIIDDDGLRPLAGPFTSESAAIAWIVQRQDGLGRTAVTSDRAARPHRAGCVGLTILIPTSRR